jgi:hypothetical protein
MVHGGCRPDSLGDVATTVVALDEHPSRVARPGRHSPVPNVGHEEGHVAGTGHDRNNASAAPFESVVGEPFERGRLSGCVTSGDQPGRTGFDRAVPEVQVSGDGEHWVGNPGVPGDIRVPRHVGTRVDVPKAPEMVIFARLLPPGRIGEYSSKTLSTSAQSRASSSPAKTPSRITYPSVWRRSAEAGAGFDLTVRYPDDRVSIPDSLADPPPVTTWGQVFGNR